MIDTLTSLRLIFALMVFASHLCMINEAAFSEHTLKEGYVGVSFFFILSGFIIAHNYTAKLADGTCSKKRFWVARFARIYPLHLLTLAITLIAGSTLTTFEPLSWAHLLTSATLTNAFIPRSDFFFALNSPAWSLCCEQLFYILFPIGISLAKSPKKLAIVALVAVATVLIGNEFTPAEYTKGVWYTNPITRLPDFVVGVLLWHIYQRIKGLNISRQAASLMELCAILLFIAFYIFAEGVPKAYRYTFYYWIPVTAIVLSFALQKGILSGLLRRKIFITGGEISYGIYLMQVLVIKAFNKYFTGIPPYVAAISVLLVIITTSYLSYRYFEKPMNRYVKKCFKE